MIVDPGVDFGPVRTERLLRRNIDAQVDIQVL